MIIVYSFSINADDRLRIERLGTDQFDSTKCLQTVSQFYQSMNTSKGKIDV